MYQLKSDIILLKHRRNWREIVAHFTTILEDSKYSYVGTIFP